MIAISNKKLVSIIAITWILSLVSTITVFYFFVDSTFLTNPSSDSSFTQIASDTTKIIRFTQTEEMDITWSSSQPLGKYINFTWTPENPNTNLILNAYIYVEYRCDNPQETAWEQGFQGSWQLDFSLQQLTSSPITNRFFSPAYRLRKVASNLEWEQLGELALRFLFVWACNRFGYLA